jgi:hypothetical protein
MSLADCDSCRRSIPVQMRGCGECCWLLSLVVVLDVVDPDLRSTRATTTAAAAASMRRVSAHTDVP